MLNFNAAKAGAYQGKVLVYSKESSYDVRVVDLIAKTTIPNGLMIITFKGAARQELTQEIPIKNESEHDWSLTATITGAEFNGEKGKHHALVLPYLTLIVMPHCDVF